ncbi:MAG: M14 family metallopeptidase [Chloroflexota bacterium]|nr:M14 family metallopeptidase [Chloroflexota bacterium]
MPVEVGKWVADSSEYRMDRYYRYADLSELLHRWADENPGLVDINSIGQSFDGKEIWVLTLTTKATGSHDTKPAYFVDANIHDGEVAGVATTLWLINHLLTKVESDPAIRTLFDETTLYVIPAINVDAMDLMLTGQASRVRSSVRPFPHKEQQDGLVKHDLDGNGMVASMRVKDPQGPWKVSERDSRLMVKRGVDETGGDYYFLLPEGTIQNWDGGAVKIAPDLMGLDVNRNFPADWAPYWEQHGAGEYPLSEPETRALAAFLVAHPNIHGAQHFHTQSAAILRPPTSKPDEDLPKFDLETYKAIGAMGEEETGYPCISIFHDFAYDKKKPIRGGLLDWVYEQLGAFAFATELWSLPKKAGVEVPDFIEFFPRRSEEVDLAMLKVLDDELDGQGYKEWEPFDHPQLGTVEIGGWDYQFAWQNPPGPWLEDVTSTNARFVIRAMKTAPKLAIQSPQVEALGGDLYKVSAIVQNTGFLPTYVSEQGKKAGVNKPVKASIELADGAELVIGKAEVELGHLDGRANQYEAPSFYTGYPIQSRAIAEWVVRQRGGTVTIRAECTKAGSTSLEVELGARGAPDE